MPEPTTTEFDFGYDSATLSHEGDDPVAAALLRQRSLAVTGSQQKPTAFGLPPFGRLGDWPPPTATAPASWTPNRRIQPGDGRHTAGMATTVVTGPVTLPPEPPTAARLVADLTAAYMPVIAAYSMCPVAHEALVRTRTAPHYDGRTIVDAISAGGMLPQLSAAVRQAVAATLAARQDVSLVFVNLEESDLIEPALGARGDPLTVHAARVVFDLSLSRFDRPIKEHETAIAWLRRRGFRFALDDFGAGTVGSADMDELRPEFVKIGANLTDRLCEARPVAELVATIARVCASRGATLVAKAIGRRADFEAAVRAGVPWLSGWHVGHPALSPC